MLKEQKEDTVIRMRMQRVRCYVENLGSLYEKVISSSFTIEKKLILCNEVTYLKRISWRRIQLHDIIIILKKIVIWYRIISSSESRYFNEILHDFQQDVFVSSICKTIHETKERLLYQNEFRNDVLYPFVSIIHNISKLYRLSPNWRSECGKYKY